MKILCVLQNAWGDRTLPMIFTPNPNNKSAKVIKKMVGDHKYHFSNTTIETTLTAKGKAKPDDKHFLELIKHFQNYDLILVCGVQAKKMMVKHKESMKVIPRIVYVPHPASRSLTNVEINEINENIELIRMT